MPKLNGNAAKLLLETNETYYWAGFLAADGSFKHNIALVLSSCEKDKSHLLKFAKFLKTTNITFYKPKMKTSRFSRNTQVVVTLQDKNIIPKFVKKFDFKPRKTYNPPNLNWLKDDKFLAFFAGFIDGDGSLNYDHKHNNNSLTIHCHYSWRFVLEFFEKTIYEICNIKPYKCLPRVSIIPSSLKNGQPLASFRIRNTYLLHCFKRKLLDLKIPLMRRKWDKIDLSKPSQFEVSAKRKEQVLIFQKQNFSSKKIAKQLRITVGHVRRLWEPNLYQYNKGLTNERKDL